MTFPEAIASGFGNYVVFSGRSSRSAYWWWFLFNIIVSVGTQILDARIGTQPILYAIAAIGLFLPSLAVAVRRLHAGS